MKTKDEKKYKFNSINNYNVVSIILVVAIILNLSNTNIVNNANKVVSNSDFFTLQSELQFYI